MTPLSFYKCLADDTRLHILLLLSEHASLCVCDLIDALQLSQPKISRHLADLRKCALVTGERRGKWVHYQLHPTLPAWCLTVLNTTTEHNPAYLQAARDNLAAAGAPACSS